MNICRSSVSWLPAVVLLSACAAAPTVPQMPALLADDRYGEPPAVLQSLDVFALSDPMRQFLQSDVPRLMKANGRGRGLYEAMRAKLRIDYDAAITRTAAEAYEARAGNCLSLVLLTAAFAKQLDIPVRYQLVHGEQSWTRVGDMVFLSGHVNIALEPGRSGLGTRAYEPGFIIDFLPASDLSRQRTSELSEDAVIAMFMNNRAAEALVAGQTDAAYWWVRAALKRNPAFVSAYNTLGLVHRRHGELVLARRTFEAALAISPDDAQLLSNLVGLLVAQGQPDEAAPYERRLARLAPTRPFQFLDAGNAELAAGDAREALVLYRRELARMPYSAEVHYAIAVASARLGDARDAEQHLGEAMRLSTNLRDRDIYAGKLQRLQALQLN